jgi:hypothetical protein
VESYKLPGFAEEPTGRDLASLGNSPSIGLLADLKAMKIWLLWKLEPSETPDKKPRKAGRPTMTRLLPPAKAPPDRCSIFWMNKEPRSSKRYRRSKMLPW